MGYDGYGTFVWDKELTKSVWYKISLGLVFNIETCLRTLKHKMYNVGFYDKKIDSVQLSVLDMLSSLFWEKKAKLVTTTVKISKGGLWDKPAA